MSDRSLRPLPVHLANAQLCWGGAALGAQQWLQGAAPWHPDISREALALRSAASTLPPARLVAEISHQAARRLSDLLDGVAAYQAHPYERASTPRRVIAQQGGATLYEYSAAGPPVVLVPSLINPDTVLDLMPGRSFVAALKAANLRVLSVDWGTRPAGSTDAALDLADVITKRLVPLIQSAAAHVGGPVALGGYCMGGLLSLAAAASTAPDIAGLALIASPYDFAAAADIQRTQRMLELVEAIPSGMPVPVDMLQMYFAALDPMLNDRKFRRFAKLDQTSDEAAFFVALETWANSGAPLARGVALDCLRGWYRDNLPGRGIWSVGGVPIDPAAFDLPTLVIAPSNDRLVPKASAEAAARALPRARLLTPPVGHVGMMVGSRAADALWEPVTDFVREVFDAA